MKNIYLITSNSYHLIEDEVHKIVGGNPVSTFDLNVVSISDVLEEASYVSLFDEERYIVVRNASIFSATKTKKSIEDLLSKNEEELTLEEKEKLEKYNNKDKILLDYLEQPNSNTILMNSNQRRVIETFGLNNLIRFDKDTNLFSYRDFTVTPDGKMELK